MKAILIWSVAEVLLLCTCSESTAQGNAESVRRFAFGTPTSVTRAGFTKDLGKVVLEPSDFVAEDPFGW